MRTKKEIVMLSKDEFRAMLFRHAAQDAEKWIEGTQMFLAPEDAAFIKQLRDRSPSNEFSELIENACAFCGHRASTCLCWECTREEQIRMQNKLEQTGE